MRLRFKKQYSGLDSEHRISYETVSVDKIITFDTLSGTFKKCFDLKGFGYVPCEFLEPAEENDLPFVDVFIQAQKDK